MNANLYALLTSRFPQDRSACCLETAEDALYSWNDVECASARIANLLAGLDLPPAARIAVQVNKSAEALIVYLATIRAGFVYLPLNTAYRANEVDYFVENAEPAVVICMPDSFGWISKIAFKRGTTHVFTLGEERNGSLLARATAHSDQFETVQSQPDDLAAILYTSGTTGRSKGAMLSHGNLSSNAVTLHAYWQWQPSDVLLHALPLFHVHGLFVACHAALFGGSKTIFLKRFEAAEVIEQLPRATVFMGVPTFYVRLLGEPGLTRRTCDGMRLFISGSAPLLPDTFKSFAERSGHAILERYGMSETVMLTSNPCDGERRGGTVGLPLPGVALRVVKSGGQACAAGDIGAIEVKGPSIFQGYWRMPEKTLEEFTVDGFFRTGDVGSFDAQGYLSIVGRSKDLIISGGFNVYPKEIELVLDDMAQVVESAVIGVPHVDFGEAVTAVVVRAMDAVLSEAAMIDDLKRRMASFKVPKRIYFVDHLPRNAMGKVQKNLLRERFRSS
ncbi:MAG: malonyl-CoA synthase [Burkholderiaceae bacterium]